MGGPLKKGSFFIYCPCRLILYRNGESCTVRPGDISPIVSDEEATFFYTGGAKKVSLAGEYNRWEQETMRQDTGLWYIRKSFPPDARIEYKYIVDGQWIPDPLNVSPSDLSDNSTLIMPGYHSDYKTIIQQDIPRGRVIRDRTILSQSMGKEMRYHVYLPPDYLKETLASILYVMDGSNYLHFAHINRVLDYLIDRGDIPAVTAVLTDPDQRDVEYTFYEPYIQYLIGELMPALEREYLGGANQIDRGVMGASFGGLTAVYLAVSEPYRFRRVLTQSGSFWPKEFALFRQTAEAVTPPIRFCLQTGTIQDTEEMNDVMTEILKAKGYPVDYVKYAESHSWINWRGHLSEGLKKLYQE